MTPLLLQMAIKKDMEALLGSLALGSGEGPFHVYEQEIPPRKEEKDYSIFPNCVVILENGRDGMEDATQDVLLVFCIRDPNPNMQGHRDLMNVIQRVREHYSKNNIISGQFVVRKPIEWLLPEDEVRYPYFFGAVQLKVEIPQIELHSDFI